MKCKSPADSCLLPARRQQHQKFLPGGEIVNESPAGQKGIKTTPTTAGPDNPLLRFIHDVQQYPKKRG